MAATRAGGWSDGLLNVGLVLGGLLVAVLLYGLASRALTPRTTPVREAALLADSLDTGARVQVEVLNASGRDGLAAAATAHLRRRGFDVLGTGTQPVQETTAVLVQQGTLGDGRHVAGALGLAPRAVGRDSSAHDYDPDVTVRLGRDYPARASFDLP